MQLSSLLLVGPNTRSSPAPAQLPSNPVVGPPKNVSLVPAGIGEQFARPITPPTSPPAIPNQSFPKPSPATRLPSIPNPAIWPITAAGSVPGGQAAGAENAGTAPIAPSAPTATLIPSPRNHARAVLHLADMRHLTVWGRERERNGATTRTRRRRTYSLGWGKGSLCRQDLWQASGPRQGAGPLDPRKSSRTDWENADVRFAQCQCNMKTRLQ